MRFQFLFGLLVQLLVRKALAACGQVCDLDAFGEKISYPNKIVASTVFATTTIFQTYKDALGSVIVQTTATTAAPAPKPTITWEVSGVTLTFPNTYVFYKSFSRSFVATDNGCSTGASTLKLGASTNYASLIFPASEVTSTLPPSGLINYLESIPTVFAQLGGAVNSSCDPTSSTPFASPATATLTTTNVLPTVTFSSTTITVSGEFQTMGASVLTVTATTPRFRNTTTAITVAIPPTSSTLTETSTTVTLSPTASSSTSILITTSVTASIASATTVVTFSGALSSLESSPAPSAGPTILPNGTVPSGIPNATTIIQTFTGIANRFADGAHVGTNGLFAGILGLAIYWF